MHVTASLKVKAIAGVWRVVTGRVLCDAAVFFSVSLSLGVAGEVHLPRE